MIYINSEVSAANDLGITRDDHHHHEHHDHHDKCEKYEKFEEEKSECCPYTCPYSYMQAAYQTQGMPFMYQYQPMSMMPQEGFYGHGMSFDMMQMYQMRGEKLDVDSEKSESRPSDADNEEPEFEPLDAKNEEPELQPSENDDTEMRHDHHHHHGRRPYYPYFYPFYPPYPYYLHRRPWWY